MQILLDSSLIIDHARTKRGRLPELIDQAQKEEAEIILSSIVLFELWRGSSMKSKKVRVDMETFISDFRVIAVDTLIAKRAGELEREEKAAGNDALIAATCLIHSAQLATLNPKDFSRVPGLNIWKSA